MKYGLFLGCTIPVRGQNYEIAARAVAAVLDIEFVDLEDFSCCGYPVSSTNSETSLALAARNLAIAVEQGIEVVTLCSACTSVLTEAAHKLDNDKELRDMINEDLVVVGREYKGGAKVKHFVRFLYEDVGVERIREKVVRPLEGVKLSAHYGCHYLRPEEIYNAFDSAEDPRTIEALIEAVGATPISYDNKLDCCGGAILGVEEDIALSMSKKKLDNVTDRGVDALVTICPFCTVMYEDNQRKIEAKFEVEYDLPVLYYPQVLGLALGLGPKELGFRLNKVKAKELLARIEGEE